MLGSLGGVMLGGFVCWVVASFWSGSSFVGVLWVADWVLFGFGSGGEWLL
jgi:hypothetical protein